MLSKINKMVKNVRAKGFEPTSSRVQSKTVAITPLDCEMYMAKMTFMYTYKIEASVVCLSCVLYRNPHF